MSDQHKQDTLDQDEVEIVDLGAPDTGLSKYFFILGKKWQAAAPFRARLITPVVALCLLIAVLQPGSSAMNNRTSGAPHTMPIYSYPSTIYIIVCDTKINISNSPGQAITWQQLESTPSVQGCSFPGPPDSPCPTSQQLRSTPPTSQRAVLVCSSRTPLPVPRGKNGKNGKNR